MSVLTVAVDRLEQWSRPGLLCIGDAAHAMSPIGGVGINLAIQDAVAAANALAATLLQRNSVEERTAGGAAAQGVSDASHAVDAGGDPEQCGSEGSGQPEGFDDPVAVEAAGAVACVAANAGAGAGSWFSSRACENSGRVRWGIAGD